jgi:hypothetical protein
LWTGENKRFGQTKELRRDVGTIHAARMPESPLINPVRNRQAKNPEAQCGAKSSIAMLNQNRHPGAKATGKPPD